MEGWHERWSKSKSKVYYANKVTGETRWDRSVRRSVLLLLIHPLLYDRATRRPTASSLGAPIRDAAKSTAGSTVFGVALTTNDML